MVRAQTEQTEQTIEIYALAIAFARTNAPLSFERTWTLFHHPQNILCLFYLFKYPLGLNLFHFLNVG